MVNSPSLRNSSKAAKPADARNYVLTIAVGFVLLIIVSAAALQVWREASFEEASTHNQLKARAAFLEQQIDAGTQLAVELANRLQSKVAKADCGSNNVGSTSPVVLKPSRIGNNVAFWPDGNAGCTLRPADLGQLAEDMSMLFAVARTIGISRLTAQIPGGWLSIPIAETDDLSKPPGAVRQVYAQQNADDAKNWLGLHSDRLSGDPIESWLVAAADAKGTPVTVEIDVPSAWFWQFTLPFEGAKNDVAILETGGAVLARGNALSGASNAQSVSDFFEPPKARSPSSADSHTIDLARILDSESRTFSRNGVRATFENLGDKPLVIASLVRTADLYAFSIGRNAIPLIAMGILAFMVLAGYIALRVIVLGPARRAELALAVLSDRLQAIFNAVPVGICLVEDDRRIVTTNDRFDALIDAGGLAADSFAETTGKDDRDGRVRLLIGEQSGSQFDERVLNTAAGRWLLVRSAPVGDMNQRAITVTDITERVQMEADLAKARDDAESASRSKAEFLATMSHEIRTPMNGVIGMVDLLAQTQLTPSQRRSLRTIRESAYALLRIINDILDFSKIEAGRLEIETIPTPLADIVEGALEPLAVAASSKKIRLLSYIDFALPEIVRGDAIRIRQILVNLCGNAVKFSSGGEVMVRADVEPDRPGWVRFSVTDHGIGISEENQTKLFQQFSQAETSTTRRFGGTGLGLAICKRLSEAMGGTIEVASVLGLGTRFAVTLPLPAADVLGDEIKRIEFTGHSVFVISRSVDGRAIIRSYLEFHHAAVQEISRLDDLIDEVNRAKIAGRRPPLLVFLSDFEASEVQGAMARLAEINSDARAIVLRDSTLEHDPFAGRDDVLSVEAQPLRRSAFVKTIAIALGLASPEAASFDEVEIASIPRPSLAEAEQKRELILVAEDNATNQEVIEGQLAKLGYACEIVGDGKLALDSWRSGRFSILLTDCHMPVMDGFELTRKIRLEEATQGRPRTPIVAITANAMKGEAERCMSSGMDAYLAKPIELKSLKSVLVKWIERAQNTPQAASVKDETTASSSDLPALDLALLRETFADNEPKIRQLLQRFIVLGRSMIEDISGIIARRDADGLSETSHKLKSSALTAGAYALAEACRKLEAASEEADWTKIIELEDQLAPALDRVRRQVDAL